MTQEYTPEQQKDIDQRRKEFEKEYIELSQKHQMDYGCYPAFKSTSQGYIIETPMIIYDKKYLSKVPEEGVVSPIQNV